MMFDPGRPDLDNSSAAYAAFSRVVTQDAVKRELWVWSFLAVSALALAGLLALLLALSRTPHVQEFLPWHSNSFFHKALITHVIFSFVVWYLCALGAFTVIASARLAGGAPKLNGLGRLGAFCAVLSFLMLFAPAILDRGEPSLNNYVPVLVDPVYYGGLAMLALGVGLAVIRLLVNLRHAERPWDAASFGVAAAGVMFLSALVCFAAAYVVLPAGLDTANFNEHLFWGGGHVLQFVNTALLLVGWYILAGIAFGRPPMTPILFRTLIGTLLLFSLPAPLLYAVLPSMSGALASAFTDLLWFGLVLQPALLAVAIAAQIFAWRGPKWSSPSFLALALSVVLFGAGGVIGYFLGPSDTRIPSHYHAMVSGVNLAVMGIYFALFLPLLDRPVRRSRWLLAQFYLYGVGQILFSVGMFLAGAQGVPRKTAGAEQGLDSTGKVISMAMTGAGGVIAVAGGILFIGFMLSCYLRKPRGTA